jgi:hypothetical protein
MKSNLGLLVFAFILLLLAAGLGYWSQTSRGLDEKDYTTITGTIKSAQEHYARKSNFLEFYIAEHAARFRIPADGYQESFNRDAFFANVKSGDRLEITIEKAELAKPFRPPLDPVDTVFVHGLKDQRATYCTLEGRKKWEEGNRFAGGILALALAGMSVCCVFGFVSQRFEGRGSSVDALDEFRSLCR